MILDAESSQPAKISYVLSNFADLREGEVLGLMNDVVVNKSANNKDDKALPQSFSKS